MLGNSFTMANHMPEMLAARLDAEVVPHTRGGARLAEHLNPKTKMGFKTQEALKNQHWDFVVLQEMSNGPVTSTDRFLKSVKELCKLIRSSGAMPVLFETWAYQQGCPRLDAMQISHKDMYIQMKEAYHLAAEENQALIACAGEQFYALESTEPLYAADFIHPSEQGSRIAMESIADAIEGYLNQR